MSAPGPLPQNAALCTTAPEPYSRGANCSAMVIAAMTLCPEANAFFNLTCPSTAQTVDVGGIYLGPYGAEGDIVAPVSACGQIDLSYALYLTAWGGSYAHQKAGLPVCVSWRCCAGVLDQDGNYCSLANPDD